MISLCEACRCVSVDYPNCTKPLWARSYRDFSCFIPKEKTEEEILEEQRNQPTTWCAR